jgi:hypothetical protein
MKKKKVVSSSKKTEKGAGAKILKLPAPILPPPVVPAVFPPPLPEDPSGADPLPMITDLNAPTAKEQKPPKVAKPIIKGSVRRVRRGNMWVTERAPRGKRKK